MTREETAKAIKVMKAYVDGKEIEVLAGWLSGYVKTKDPLWAWECNSYRIKQPEETVPWDNPSDVPPGCMIRSVANEGFRFVVVSVTPNGVEISGGVHKDWNNLFSFWEYSTDCENWFPCTKKKEA